MAPSSKRILEDIEGVFAAMDIVVNNKGAYVHGLAERTGRRFIKMHKKENCGGHWIPMDPSIRYLANITKMHPSLRNMLKEARANEVQAE